MPRSSNCLLPSGFPHQNTVYIFLPHTHHMPHPPHCPWFDYPSTIWWGVQIMKHLSVLVSKSCSHFLPLMFKYLPQHPAIKHHQSTFHPSCKRQVSHPHKATRKLQFCIQSRMTKWKEHIKNIIERRNHCSPKQKSRRDLSAFGAEYKTVQNIQH